MIGLVAKEKKKRKFISKILVDSVFWKEKKKDHVFGKERNLVVFVF